MSSPEAPEPLEPDEFGMMPRQNDSGVEPPKPTDIPQTPLPEEDSAPELPEKPSALEVVLKNYISSNGFIGPGERSPIRGIKAIGAYAKHISECPSCSAGHFQSVPISTFRPPKPEIK